MLDIRDYLSCDIMGDMEVINIIFQLLICLSHLPLLSYRPWLVLSPCNFNSVLSFLHSHWAPGHITLAVQFFMVVQG